MKAVYMTDQGKIRSHNEDCGGIFLNGDGNRLAIVADGMGGHRAGDVASGMALTEMKKFWETSSGINRPDQAETWFKEHITLVNDSLFKHARANEECDGMGTTIVAAIMLEDFATIANIGDSRCYILNESGFRKITEDHSLVNELLRSGQISREDAENHPRKNVLLRALGTEEKVEMDVSTIMFEEGDALLLCSDGLSNKVNEKEMAEVLKSGDSLEDKAARLVSLANEYGGEDNITLAIVEFTRVSEGDD
ncbi:Stp1/IreP family PP2C-type Ser/Thr phosphatase [Neobacillus notoginsengisoli]|uniref:protein-serine/threonine phosphatase n=1 Tax=Neobacillus notoginsengisoli TaxID=1578198 RepID=A0A417YR58_9BACI|nr:Stp1/IreP family PP2C-type Ser/Thr phosphatase [Neobacillus notoginsengisoli]RHW36458.1 Stp1/IreP family PP2C-type Ser/Thr phosphatase [Neobacillus notoginsengisoli]